MSRGMRKSSSTGYYHVMQRGTGKQAIFESDSDRLWYLKQLKKVKGKYGFELVAYCLMRNHVHLLIRADSVSQLSRIMQAIGTRYAMYFNLKYDHVGYVFQDRFLSEPIESERYLLACVRYIHNNPAKAGLAPRDEFPWSSYNEYLTKAVLCDTNNFLAIVGGVRKFIEMSSIKDNIVFNEMDEDESDYTAGLEIISNILDEPCTNGLIVKTLDKKKRDEIIRQLKHAGLSLKKIEMLTGVTKSISKRI